MVLMAGGRFHNPVYNECDAIAECEINDGVCWCSHIHHDHTHAVMILWEMMMMMCGIMYSVILSLLKECINMWTHYIFE